MPVYERVTRVRAPLDELWSFHSEGSGLQALTPDWMGLRIEEVVGPDGERDPDVLEAGSRLRMTVRPFGVGPRQGWVSRIVEREEADGVAYFVDEMEEGPFPRWRHTHRFVADGDATMIHDRVEYSLPFGPLGRTVAPLARLGFEPMFWHRHRRTKELFE